MASFKRRYNLNKTEAKAYAMLMKEIEETFSFIPSSGALREGCYVEFVKNDNNRFWVVKGTITNDSYGAKTGQHTFTITDDDGSKHLVKGRNLYNRLLVHQQGAKSIKLENLQRGIK